MLASTHLLISIAVIKSFISIHNAILSIFYGRRILTEVFVPCRREKKLQVSDFFYCWRHFEDFSYFWTEKLPIGEKFTVFSACRRKK